MTKPQLMSNHELLTDLGALRQRVAAGYDYRRLHAGDDARWQAGTTRWNRLTEQYLERVSMVLVEVEPDELESARDELADRLERGLAMLETDETVAHFAALLARYEATCDVLRGLTETRKTLHQLDRMATMFWLQARKRATLDAAYPDFVPGGRL